jgi:branched-chain amino acid transport system ATP-binding protein
MAADEGTALILVEQHSDIALGLTENAIVMERGTIVYRAPSRELLNDQATLDRFIGLRIDGAESSLPNSGGP